MKLRIFLVGRLIYKHYKTVEKLYNNTRVLARSCRYITVVFRLYLNDGGIRSESLQGDVYAVCVFGPKSLIWRFLSAN